MSLECKPECMNARLNSNWEMCLLGGFFYLVAHKGGALASAAL